MGLCNFDSVSPEAASRIQQFAQHAFNSYQSTAQTYLLSRYVLQCDVPGDFVECGVAAGAQLAAMGQAMADTGKSRTIHAYDSFCGIPFAGPEDDQQPGFAKIIMDQSLPLRQRLRSSGVSACALGDVIALWTKWGFSNEIQWHKGWFQDTMPECRVPTISFLRLDGDLYESTWECLVYLYHRVHVGGIVFIDDWGLKGCQKAVEDFLRFWEETYNERRPVLLFDKGIKDGGDSAYWIR